MMKKETVQSETKKGEKIMIMKTQIIVKGDNVLIDTGMTFELINRDGKTIWGNVEHIESIRTKAIALLNK